MDPKDHQQDCTHPQQQREKFLNLQCERPTKISLDKATFPELKMYSKYNSNKVKEGSWLELVREEDAERAFDIIFNQCRAAVSQMALEDKRDQSLGI